MEAGERIARSEAYLRERTGSYEQRRGRYLAAGAALVEMGLNGDSLLVDVGAGWTELDYCLRDNFDWRGRYWPVDGQYGGTDLETWMPVQEVDFFVLLEVLEHLRRPFWGFINQMQWLARRGVVVSVPNPRTTDVLGMDGTHVRVVTREELESFRFVVEERSFYGQEADTLFGVWAS